MGVLIKNKINYTGSGDILNQPVIYSDSERCIGVWRDGKPLYQKSFFNNNAYSSSSNASFNINFGQSIFIIDAEGYVIRPDKWKINFNDFFNSEYVRFANNTSDYRYTSNISINITPWSGTGEYCITIKYTKSSDTAGTGPWAPTGATPIHYSLEEQVIGTWIDGKPLYQKSFTGTAPSSSGSFNVFDVSSLNVDNAVSLYGSIRNPVNQTYSGQGFVLWMRYNQPTINENHIAISVTNSDYLSGNLYATIQYTKTTD